MRVNLDRDDAAGQRIDGGLAALGRPLFDEKIAQSSQMVYTDDNTKKAQWGKTLRNYLVGRSWKMRQLLLCAEGF